MKSRIVFVVILMFILMENSLAQGVKIYNPEADAKSEIAAAVEKASKNGKHVFLQIGGNWCSWCIMYHNFVNDDDEIKNYVDDNYVVLKVNYDEKNKNEKVLAELDYPQRFGFPVFVILNGKGERVHTQNSALLEKGSGYDRDRVLQFYKHWSPVALNPDSYK